MHRTVLLLLALFLPAIAPAAPVAEDLLFSPVANREGSYPGMLAAREHQAVIGTPTPTKRGCRLLLLSKNKSLIIMINDRII